MTINRHLPTWLCICLLCAAAIVVAQQKDQKVFRLPLEASKAYAEIEAAEKPLIDQLNAHERTKLALQIGAGVPLEARGHCVFDHEILVCAAPQASSSPEKK